MRDLNEIRSLLDEIEQKPADSLESQDLDFKEWNTSSMDKAVRSVVQMVVCMANGGGGTGRGSCWSLRHHLRTLRNVPAPQTAESRLKN